MKVKFFKNKSADKAQAMVEFALALPIVLLLMIGMLEVGRLIVYYTAVNSAAREAARYGAASGTVNGVPRYCDVAGIRAAAVKAGFFSGLKGNASDVVIQYDSGPGSTPVGEGQGPCAAGGNLKEGDRILITVTVNYQPTINFPPSNVGRNVVGTAARTILDQVSLSGLYPPKEQSDPNNSFPPTPTRTATATPNGGGGGGAPTATVSASITPTGTIFTPTATLPVTSTPIVILPTPVLISPACTLGHTDLSFTSGNVATWSLVNYYETTVAITKIEVFSAVSGQQVTLINFGGMTIFSGNLTTPALIKGGWSGNSIDRQLFSGQAKSMNMILSKNDTPASLQIKVTFDIGSCMILDSSLSQP